MTEAIARHTDVETSHEAAASVVDLNARQRAVLNLFNRERRPMHDEALVRVYTLTADDDCGQPTQTPQSIRSRRAELVRLGLVEHTGEYARTESGCRSRVWAVPVV